MWNFLSFTCWQLTTFLKTQSRPNKIHHWRLGGPTDHQFANEDFIWPTFRAISWLSQADKVYGREVKLIFSVLLLVSIFTERFGEGGGWERVWNWFKISSPWPQTENQERGVTVVPVTLSLKSPAQLSAAREPFPHTLTHDFSILQAGC